MKQRPLLGEILIKLGLINDVQLNEGLKYAEQTNYRLGHALIDLGYINEAHLIKALSQQLEHPVENISIQPVSKTLLKNISKELCLKWYAIPYENKNDVIRLLCANPDDEAMLEEFHFILQSVIEPVIAIEKQVQQLIEISYGQKVKSAEKDSAPTIALIDTVINEAIKSKATDIHIEPHKNEVIIRMRIDGVMKNHLSLPLQQLQALVNRIKVLSHLDLAEHRLPQDGSFSFDANRDIDIRVSVMPSAYGEAVVLRILGSGNYLIKMDKLGFATDRLKTVYSLLTQPQGLFVITGPGKRQRCIHSLII